MYLKIISSRKHEWLSAENVGKINVANEKTINNNHKKINWQQFIVS